MFNLFFVDFTLLHYMVTKLYKENLVFRLFLEIFCVNSMRIKLFS